MIYVSLEELFESQQIDIVFIVVVVIFILSTVLIWHKRNNAVIFHLRNVITTNPLQMINEIVLIETNACHCRKFPNSHFNAVLIKSKKLNFSNSGAQFIWNISLLCFVFFFYIYHTRDQSDNHKTSEKIEVE